jgi:hypothetical protein
MIFKEVGGREYDLIRWVNHDKDEKFAMEAC